MKIALVTTYPEAEEATRIQEEVIRMGHEFELHNFYDINLHFTDSGMTINGVMDWKQYDLIIVRGVFNVIKAVAMLVNYWRSQGIKVFDNNVSEHQYVINKVADFVKLSSKGIPLPETFYSRRFEEFQGIGEKLGYPFVLKSTRMGKGSGVYKMDSPLMLEDFISEAKEKDRKAKDYLLQKMINYVRDLRLLMMGDEIFSMRRIPREGDFRANFSLGGSVELYDPTEEEKSLARRALDATNLPIGGVDILVTEDGKLYILEVNHTAGFVGMEQATGRNMGELYVNFAIENAK